MNQRNDPYSDSSHERRCNVVNINMPTTRTQRSQSKIESSVNDQRTALYLKRSSSCSALPSNIKLLKEHTDVNSITDRPSCRPKASGIIEEKENAILQQCFRNEGLSPECADMGCVYHGYHDDGMSRFPLPDHLNYPLNKYYKSENYLNKLQPLKKIRTSLRKLKTKTNNIHLSTPDRYETYSFSERNSITPTIDDLSSNYFDSFQNLEDSETIMTRLGKSPNGKKPWIKKLFKWGVGKSYVIKKKAAKKSEDNHGGEPTARKRSNSTKSIPEAFINLLSKSQEKSSATTTATHEFEFMVPTTLQRANSMPSISLHRIQPANDVDVIYFNESGLEPKNNSSKNHLHQQQHHHKRFHNDQRYDIENNNRSPIIHLKQSHQKPSAASCQDIRVMNVAEPTPPSHGHCQCCSHAFHYQSPSHHHVQQPSNYGPPSSYPEENWYTDDDYCEDDGEQMMVKPIAYYKNVPSHHHYQQQASIIAPLDMRVSIERRAERRKICNMVFDTFV